LLHELTHWTRHEKRLSPEFGRKRWGDAGYATEGLLAEPEGLATAQADACQLVSVRVKWPRSPIQCSACRPCWLCKR
jgi:antirestriction protein ArdC